MPQDIILQFNLFGIFDSLTGFLILFIGAGAMAGGFSQKLSISAFGAILVYTHIVINTDLFIFNALMYLILTIIILWVSSLVVSSYLETQESGVT